MARAKAKEEDPEFEDEFEDFDEELEELEPEEPAPRAKRGGAKGKTKKAKEARFGVNELCEHIAEVTNRDLAPRQIRILLRKLAREGEIDREIAPDSRTRYAWKGPNDPEVKRIVKAVKDGAVEKQSQESLERVKNKNTSKKKTAAKKKK